MRGDRYLLKLVIFINWLREVFLEFVGVGFLEFDLTHENIYPKIISKSSNCVGLLLVKPSFRAKIGLVADLKPPPETAIRLNFDLELKHQIWKTFECDDWFIVIAKLLYSCNKRFISEIFLSSFSWTSFSYFRSSHIERLLGLHVENNDARIVSWIDINIQKKRRKKPKYWWWNLKIPNIKS